MLLKKWEPSIFFNVRSAHKEQISYLGLVAYLEEKWVEYSCVTYSSVMYIFCIFWFHQRKVYPWGIATVSLWVILHWVALLICLFPITCPSKTKKWICFALQCPLLSPWLSLTGCSLDFIKSGGVRKKIPLDFLAQHVAWLTAYL